MFEHDDEQFSKRFASFPEDQLHMFEILTKSMYVAAKNLMLKPSDLEKLSGVVGKFWKTIPTIAKENPLEIPWSEEMDLLIEIAMISTNIEWSKYTEEKISEKKCVLDMLMTLEVLKRYVSQACAEKINIIIEMYYGETMRMD